jgi:hypothetical protein
MSNRPGEVFTLEIELGNSSMRTHGDIASALRELAARFDRFEAAVPLDGDEGKVRDLNGNSVGAWVVSR